MADLYVDGERTTTYDATRRALGAVAPVADLVADMDQTYDGLALGFVPDHYLTEYHYPASASRAAQVTDLERFRGMGPRDILARALVLGGYSFPALDLQTADLDVARTPVLVLASASTLDAVVQRRLADYIEAGGRLLLNGVLPDVDHDGHPCTVLAEALGVRVTGRVDGDLHYFPSVVPHGWAAPAAETRIGYAQLLDAPGATAVLTEVGSGSPVAVEVEVGAGRALVIACDYPCHLGFWRSALTALDVRRRWVATSTTPGLVVTPTADRAGQQLLHLVHVGPAATDITLTHDGLPFLGGRVLTVPARSALTLPLQVSVDDTVLEATTAELAGVDGSVVLLRATQWEDVAVLRTRRRVTVDRGTVVVDGDRVTVTVAGGPGAVMAIRLQD